MRLPCLLSLQLSLVAALVRTAGRNSVLGELDSYALLARMEFMLEEDEAAAAAAPRASVDVPELVPSTPGQQLMPSSPAPSPSPNGGSGEALISGNEPSTQVGTLADEAGNCPEGSTVMLCFKCRQLFCATTKVTFCPHCKSEQMIPPPADQAPAEPAAEAAAVVAPVASPAEPAAVVAPVASPVAAPAEPAAEPAPPADMCQCTGVGNQISCSVTGERYCSAGDECFAPQGTSYPFGQWSDMCGDMCQCTGDGNKIRCSATGERYCSAGDECFAPQGTSHLFGQWGEMCRKSGASLESQMLLPLSDPSLANLESLVSELGSHADSPPERFQEASAHERRRKHRSQSPTRTFGSSGSSAAAWRRWESTS